MDATTTAKQFLSMLDAEQIKRALKLSIRAMSDPCEMPGCTALSPGPACTRCNAPLCMAHIFVRASAPTQPLCPNCITVEHASALADQGMVGDEDGSDGDEPAPPKRRKRRPRKK